MRVETTISGAHCVVFHTQEHYIDARKDVRRPWATFVDVVRGGQVYRRECVPNEHAPETIIRLVREEFNY